MERMTMPVAIDLTADERALVDDITFEPGAINGPEAHKANGDKVVRLWELLKARHAIPEQRVRYFTDADYNIGGHGKSIQGTFERNGCQGEDILRHGHFLQHLHYMIFGPHLPASIVEQFRDAVAQCGDITSGDLIPLSNTAKQLARASGLGKNAKDAFFQLALEFGMDPREARYVRDAVGRS